MKTHDRCLLSVVIPTYNRSSELVRNLGAIMAAGLPSVEVVVVDDGSSDNTAQRVGEWPGVRCLRQSRRGPAAARNFGLRESDSHYVLFIDDDDWWCGGGHVTRLLRALETERELDVAFGDALIGNDESGYTSFMKTFGGRQLEELPRSTLHEGLVEFERWPFLRLLATRNVLFLGSMLWRRSALEGLGGFDETLRGAADFELFMRLVAGCRVGFSEGEPIAYYLKHDSAMTRDLDHMFGDLARALELAVERCTVPPDVGEFLSRRRREMRFGWSYLAYDRGDYALAHERLSELLRGGGTPTAREMAYWLITLLPGALIGGVRAAKWRLTGDSGPQGLGRHS